MKTDAPKCGTRARRGLASGGVLLLAALAACGGGRGNDMDGGGSGDATPEAAPPDAQPVVVRLNVDANRNGDVENTDAERAGRDAWSTTAGAMFLANLDDDDMDTHVDAEDEMVNGDMDAEDLARLRLEPSPGTPLTASASFTLEGATSDRVRFFRRGGDGSWTVFNPMTDRLTGAQLREGVEFGVEGRTYADSAWNGQLHLSVTVTDGATMLGTDRVAMHVAPWVIDNSLEHTEQTYVMAAQGFRPSDLFVHDLEASTTEDMVPLTEFDAWRTEYIDQTDPNSGPDPWTQDIMEFGWSAIPGPGGARRSMNVVLRTAPTDRLAANVTSVELLSPGMGFYWRHAARRSANHDPSLDSFGNLEIFPPYDNGTQHFPFGRMLYNWTATRYSDEEMRSFLDAQQVQGPPLRVDASWLLVGHVDELFSWVPSTSSRYGWKLLLASPTLGRQNLMNLVAANAANGSQLLFRGQLWYDVQPDGTVRPRAAQRTLDNLLADTDLMAFNQEVQAHIDVLRMQIQQETGLPDTDIVEIPFLWERVDQGRALAYQPGTVNLLLTGRTALIAKPHGPVLNGMDVVQQDMTMRMSALGITARYAEQWDLLHAAEGEVHCGTNALRSIPMNYRWWELAR